MTKHHDDRHVHTITDAPEAHTEEMRGRVIRYSISMGIRLVCIVLMFLVHGWLQWACFAGAIFLPWIAVILANAGSDRTRGEKDPEFMIETAPPQLTGPPAPEEPGVVPGELADDDAPASGDEHHDDAPQDGGHPDDGAGHHSGNTTGRNDGAPQ